MLQIRIRNAATWSPHPLALGFGSKDQNSTLSENGHVAYIKLKESRMQQHGSKYFARSPPHDPRGWGKKVKFNFVRTWSEHGHVAYQIKGHYECSNMVANILLAERKPPLPPPPPPEPGSGSTGQNSTFSKFGHVAYTVKGNHEFSNMVVNTLLTIPPPPRPQGMGSKDQIQLCHIIIMLHIKFKGIMNAATR